MECLENNVVIDFVQRRLAPEQIEDIDEHLDSCSECRQVVAELARDAFATGSADPALGAEGGAAESLARGSAVGRYIVLDVLGAGSMGVVYAAFDPDLNRKVALKLLRSPSRAEAHPRLLREAQALARLSHPNVVAIHDVGTHGELVYLAMEFVEGQTMRAWLQADNRSRTEIVRTFIEAGRGLVAAHEAGLIHRDFKPDNVMIDDRGGVRVTDFGLARSLDGAQSHGQTREAADDSLAATLTRSGSLLGTPVYMAPEQLRGEAVDAAADQFSFAVSLYEALYGERPFRGQTLEEIAQDIAAGVRLPSGRRVPGWLAKVLLRGLSCEKSSRYESMSAMLRALQNSPASRRRRGLVIAVAAALPVTVFMLARSAQSEDRRCQGAAAELEGVWDEGVKRAVKTSFLATDKPYAEDIYNRVERSLNSYADQWIAAHTGTCTRTQIDGTQSEQLLDVRMDCLARRRSALRELTALLRGDVDADTLSKATLASQDLPSIAECESAVSAAVPLPADSAVRERVEALKKQVDEARALEKLGKEAAGLELALSTAKAADAVDYSPLNAEARFLLGSLQRKAGQLTEAEENLRQAAVAAGEAGSDVLMARIAARLIEVSSLQGRFDEAAAMAWAADAAAARAGNTDELQMRVSASRCLLDQERGNYESAVELCTRAVAHAEEAFGSEHTLVAGTITNLAGSLRASGQREKALEHFERAHAIFLNTVGENHPHVAAVLSGWARTLSMLDRREEALPKIEKALEIEERMLGPDHPHVGMTLSMSASLNDELGNSDRARAHAERALKIFEGAFGPEHQLVANAHSELGRVFRSRGEFDLARLHLEEGHRIFEQMLGPDHVNVAVALSELAELAFEQNNAEEALQYCERSLAIDEKRLAPEAADLWFGLECVARGQLAMGRPERAIDPLERALALELSTRGRSRVQFLLATALWDANRDRKRARDLAEKARDGFEAIGNEELAEVESWLRDHGGR